MAQCSVESYGFHILSCSVGTIAKLMSIEGWRKAGFNMVQNQPFEALHNYGRECNWAKVIEAVCGGFLGYGDDFRQDGTEACKRERLKMVVKIPESWSTHALSTLPVTPSGPTALLVFTALSTRLTSCPCMVSGGRPLTIQVGAETE